MNFWAAAVAKYCAAFSECQQPLTEDAVRKVTDALAELQREHYQALRLMLDLDGLRAAHVDVAARAKARAERTRLAKERMR